MSDYQRLTSAIDNVDGVWEAVYTLSPAAADALRDAIIVLDVERERLADDARRVAKVEKRRARRVARRRERVVRTARILWPHFDTQKSSYPRLALHVIREAILIDQAYNPAAWK